MTTNESLIRIRTTDVYVPEQDGDAFHVLSGVIMVYVAPKRSGQLGRRQFLCEVPSGHLIPAFVYRDADYCDWRFVFVGKEDAEIAHLEGKSTSVLKRKFAAFAGLEQERREGFAACVVDYYRRESLKDNIFIERGSKSAPEVESAAYDVIKKAFDSDDSPGTGGTPLYRAVVYACQRAKIPVLDSDELMERYGTELTVSQIAHASRFACRNVVLDAGWNHKDCGYLIGFIDGAAVACVPSGFGKYEVYYGESGERGKLTDKIAQTIHPRAILLSPTLPGKSLDSADIRRFVQKSISRVDLYWVIALGLIGTLIGTLLPTLNQKIYDDYIPLGDIGQLAQICMVIASFMIANLFFDIVKKLCEYRIGSKVAYSLQNAVFYRVFHLPESFFRDYESADLAQRIVGLAEYTRTFVNVILVSGLSALLSLLYLFRMFKYSGKLSWMALALLAVYAVLIYVLSILTAKQSSKIEESKGRASSRLYQYLTGIEKIRMAGVEDRAAYEYLIPFSEKQNAEISRSRITAVISILAGSASVLFSMVFYYLIVKNKLNISTGAFMAFNSAFGALSASVMQLVSSIAGIVQMKPNYERAKPVLLQAIEDSEDASPVQGLQGNISLSHVTFSYGAELPPVLHDLSLEVKAGEYIGIVGPSGCGKSTLLKLLMGFEQPTTGQICYDNQDLKNLDKRELRKNLGVVLQNGKLISGSIYENITITAPSATMADVQRVIEAVGLKDDIDQMPMGIHTVMSENSGTISGGQQQRILIARAIIGAPSILLFDEATSALDNLTQAAVSESLDQMQVTRIVVAHRLSTIRNCDRIIVLDHGGIAEEGNYQSLMERNGLFAQMAARQLVD